MQMQRFGCLCIYKDEDSFMSADTLLCIERGKIDCLGY